jgi:hypothetical protein
MICDYSCAHLRKLNGSSWCGEKCFVKIIFDGSVYVLVQNPSVLLLIIVAQKKFTSVKISKGCFGRKGALSQNDTPKTVSYVETALPMVTHNMCLSYR